MQKLLAAFLLLIIASCNTPERNCANFKTGTFEFETLVGTELKKTKFVRNDSIEIDYYDNKIDTFSIRWVNDCEYVMKKLRPKNQAEKEPVLFKVLTTNGDEYTFEYSMLMLKKNRKRVSKKGTAKKISSEVVN
jgi:hypothetical protein